MKSILSRRLLIFAVSFALLFAAGLICFDEASSGVFAQSRRQPPANQQRRRNQRPEENPTASPTPTPEQLPGDVVNTPGEAEVVRTETGLVNVDAVVINRRTNQLITGLRRENFAIFEDNVRQDITFFSTPEAPITVAMVLEYSKLTDRLGGDNFEPGRYEVLRPTAMFLSQYIRPPDDYVSVVAYDMRATPLTDFTNDPARIQQVINLLLRNPPAFSEANLYDAMRLVLVGGRGDSVVLDNRRERTEEYAGLASLQGRRRAMILICSGVDTFSRINYGNARRIAQNSGVPIYIIGTANLFMARYGDRLNPTDDLLGNPGRMTMLQAQNALRTFASETGGAYYPVTFEGQLPGVLQSINALLRNQYSLGYNPGNRRDGRQHRLVVRVDVDGDGQFESDREYTVNSRRFYNAPRADGTTRN